MNACRRCRQRKVKCSGTAPCLNCAKRSQSCTFDEADRRVIILERHLRELQQGATASRSQSHRLTNTGSPFTTARDVEDQFNQPLSRNAVPDLPILDGSAEIDLLRDVSHAEPENQPRPLFNSLTELEDSIGMHMLLTSNYSNFCGYGKAPSRHVSTWALSYEVRQVLGPSLGEQHSFSRDGSGASYSMSLRCGSPLESLALSLPPKDNIIHLAQVADFHLNANCLFLNFSGFLQRLNGASIKSLQTASGVWRVKLLLVIALGRFFLERGATSSGPPGIREFLQGTHDLPPTLILRQDPVIALETLCLLAIYSQAADMHEVAYLYTGQASRLARSCEIDQEGRLDDNFKPLGKNDVQKLWWTVCALDQRHSAVSGVSPDYVAQEEQDKEHSAEKDLCTSSSFTQWFNFSVANQLAKIMKVLSAHSKEEILSSSFIDEVVIELTALQSLGKRITTLQLLCYDRSLLTISRPIAALHLSYCHCIIRAAKPILTHHVKMRDDISPEATSTEVRFKIITTCINAACHSLNIISALREQNLLETFLFFDLEIIFLAALSLVLANIIIPVATGPSFIHVAKEALEYMSYRGNLPAKRLKDELNYICVMAASLPPFLHRPLQPSIVPKAIPLIQDGLVLNEAIFDVIDLDPTAGHSDDLLQENARDHPMENQWPQHEIQQTATLTQNPPWGVSPLPTMNSLPHSDEIYIDGFNAADIPFTLDMADLQWLDSVQ
ncbi:hypothetical protein N431DRAFT_476868 [Stipitochalara longipes BDJ]|nr:hypothetical protein N431DRAFT_476868 [Stipitochalara longipes BDJ]